MDDDLCQVCGLPLPEIRHWRMLYHKGRCAAIAAEENRIFKQSANIPHRHYLKRHLGRKRDPMKRLGLDYVVAKLAEIEKENRS
jgi:hypothetical protein